MKKISFIIPVYNTQGYLQRCFDSFNDAKSEDIEVIIVNDGSTDKSEEVIKDYLIKDPTLFHYFKQENKGAAEARRRGIKEASGEFIAFLDSDDAINYDNFLFMYDVAKERKVKIVKGAFKIYHENIPFLSVNNKKSKIKEINFIKNKKNICVQTSVLTDKIIHNSLLCYFDSISRVNEDLECVPFIYYKARKMIEINKIVYYYYRRNTSSSIMGLDVSNVEAIKNTIYPLMNLKEKFVHESIYNIYKNEIDAIIIKHITQRITSVIFSLSIKNRKEVIKILVDILSVIVPKWWANKYYIANFKGFEINDFFVLTVSKMKIYKYNEVCDKTLNLLLEEYADKINCE